MKNFWDEAFKYPEGPLPEDSDDIYEEYDDDDDDDEDLDYEEDDEY